MSSLRQRFGGRVAELRRILDMKRETFSEEINLSTKEAAEIEKGRAFPRPETIEKIAAALKVPLKELFDFGEGRYFPPPPPLTMIDTRRAIRRPSKKNE